MQQHISGESEALLDLIQVRLNTEKDLVANTATCTSLLYEGMEAVDWVGLYFLREGELVLGPFQGRSARARLPLSHPVAGRVVREGRTVIIDDLTTLAIEEDDFPARSQILVPIFLHERIVALLQVDSPFVNRFKSEDQLVLERAVSLLVASSNTSSLIPKRSPLDQRKRPFSPAMPPQSGRTRHQDNEDEAHTERWLLEPPVRTAHYPAGTTEPSYRDDSPRRRGRARDSSSLSGMVLFRRIFASIVAISFFAFSLTNAMHVHPPIVDTPLQIVEQKAIAIFAFAGIGFFFALGWRSSIRRSALNVTLYGLLIEIAQMLVGAPKTLLFHGIDVVCAMFGGYLGAAIVRAIRRRRNPHASNSR